MREQTRSRIADGLERARLLRPAERLREGWLTLRAQRDLLSDRDGVPIPPPRLRLLVDGRTGDSEAFLRVGEQMCGAIQGAVASLGTAPAELRTVLDFGCGCGRVARHWSRAEGPEIYGCDYNPDLVAWCSSNLPSLRVTRNQLAPPTPYVTGSFDLIYGLSVFSHLDEPLQGSWLAEFRRLLRPGGLLVLSVLGDRLRHRLDAGERERFDRGQVVVKRPRLAGRNLCTVYHPRVYVTDELLGGCSEVRRFDLGSPTQPILQDAYIARL
ncbi:MAG TPA: class I SAM-dependent methyltransferase [Solirubrobacterales bacterium]|nr:class I SAM-dependent methyltransferase [Solirubrobacterales bacterium]